MTGQSSPFAKMSSVGQKRSSTKRGFRSSREHRDERFVADPSERILTPRTRSEFGRSGGVPLVNAGPGVPVLFPPTKEDAVPTGVAARLGGGESDPSSIWQFGLCDFDAANSHFED